jgi:HAMP domain-containing protein/HPt (histidine-containing phosphotransfer) domain-containing protein
MQVRWPWWNPSGERSSAALSLTISQKLIALIVMLMIGVVGALATFLATRQLEGLRDDLYDKARTYGAVIAQQARSAIAFSDHETAREVLGSFADDHDVASIRLYTSTGDVLFSQGEASSWAPRAMRVTSPRVVATRTRVAAVVPVTSIEGPRGTLVLELSTAALEQERRQVAVMSTVTGLVALILSSLVAWWIANRLTRRLRVIAEVATKVADGDLAQQAVNDLARDEIGLLATAFNKMLAQLRRLIAHIQELAQREKERLETLVSERTAQLERRNVEMRQVFDQVDQGLIIVDLDGALADEHSAAVERWLGPLPEPRNLLAYVRQFAPAMADWFELTWMSLDDGSLPIEVALVQLPSRFEVSGRQLDLSYKPFTDTGGSRRILVVITDVTAAIQRQLAARHERETAALMSWLLRDLRGAQAFLAEVTSLIDRLGQPESEAHFRRLLHTIKGSCALAELSSLAELSHELETLDDDDPAGARARVPELATRWNAATSRLRAGLADAADRVDVYPRDLRSLERAIARDAPHPELARLVASWRDERVAPRFERLAEHARQLAARLGKAPVQILVEVDPELRLPEERWAPFWAAFIHPINNAVDHGLLTPAERDARAERAGVARPQLGELRLGARVEGGLITIEVHDNGAGIDWARVAEAARRRGLPAETAADLTEALFADGLSTRAEVTMSSGRGVGMAALRQVVEATGGEIFVESEPARGTTLRFTWPIAERPHALARPPQFPHETSREIACIVS